MSEDFDFKIGKSHYRGHGILALAALAIVRLPLAVLFSAGGFSLYSVLPLLLQAIRGYFGH
jgi:hypothetical protein